MEASDRSNSTNTYTINNNLPEELERLVEEYGQKGNHMEGRHSRIFIEDDKVVKLYEDHDSLEKILSNLNHLLEAEIPFPEHEIYEVMEDIPNRKVDSVVVRNPICQTLPEAGKDAVNHIDTIEQYIENAAENNYRIDPRPQNWGITENQEVVYFDTGDNSSIKKDKNHPNRWMAKFIENGTEKIEDRLYDEVAQEFYDLADTIKRK